jgi:hypothetical protein
VFASLGSTARFLFAPEEAKRRLLLAGVIRVTASPTVFLRGNIKTSQVSGEPPCEHALLFDRGGLEDPALLRSLKFCLPLCKRRRLPQLRFRGSITRPAHSLFTLCGESHPSTRTKLGSGCWPALPDRIIYLRGSSTKFQSLDFLLVQI